MATILGTSGNDPNLNGTSIADTIFGLAGNDILNGNGGNDTLNAGSGNDRLNGGTGNDTLNGGTGSDVLNGGVGNDVLNGGTGNDTADYSTATAGVTVSLNVAGAQNTGGAGTDTLTSIENLIGSNFNDKFGLFALYDDFARHYTLNGGAGNDELTVSDDINFNDSATLNGGAGNDTLTGFNFDQVTFNGDAGDDTIHGSGTLNGGAGNDTLRAWGGFNNNAAEGTLNGGAGNDTLLAFEGYFTLNGGAGADRLEHIPGGSARRGSDFTFEYKSVNDTPSGSGRDTIIGFTGDGAGFGDEIDLSAIDANALVAGNQAFTFIGNALFTAAGQLRYNGDILSGSTDADAASEFQIQLVGTPTLVIGGVGTDVIL